RGADGKAVIPAGVEQFLRQQVSRAERRHAGRHTPMPARVETDMTVAACSADDPGLVAAALPLAARLQQVPAVVRGLQTLRDHGMLGTLWEDGLRETVTEIMAPASYYAPWWEAVLAFGDTGDDAQLDKASRRLRVTKLPRTDEPDSWTAPNTGSQHY